MTVAIGQLIDGKYRILRLLGRGGMGAVYEAEHVVLGRHVALKLLAPALAGDEGAVRRLFREARAAAGIGHENICEVLDVGRAADDAPYLVMPLLQGRSLAAAIAEAAPFPVERAVAVAAQLLDALEAAHAAGIIHRDLKPDNVHLIRLAGRDDFVKVLDFGICKVQPPAGGGAGGTTTTGMVLGTPAYMSPEQARGTSDPRTDVWAVGVILYEMLAGRPPFSGGNYNVVVAAVLTSPVPPLHARRPELLPALETVVLRALERDAARRYASAAAFRHALVEACTAAGIPVPDAASAAPPTPPPAEPAADAPAARDPGTVAEPWARPAARPSTGAGTVAPKHITPSSAAAGPDAARRRRLRRVAAAALAGSAVVGAVLAVLLLRHDGPARPASRDTATDGVLADVLASAGRQAEAAAAAAECPAGMTLVPAGPFVMGSEGSVARAEERPERVVTLPAFCLASTEATRAAWRACEEAGACTAPDAACTAGETPTAEDQPVTCIDARQAAAFCAWTGGRLPKEAEWEKAARGGCELVSPESCGAEDRRSHPWGDEAPGCTRANLAGCAGRPDRVGTRPRGDSPYGLHDLAGNAAEWIADDGVEAGGPDDGDEAPALRGVRGGSWNDPPRWVRVTARGRFDPAQSSPYIGVRCAAEPGL